ASVPARSCPWVTSTACSATCRRGACWASAATRTRPSCSRSACRAGSVPMSKASCAPPGSASSGKASPVAAEPARHRCGPGSAGSRSRVVGGGATSGVGQARRLQIAVSGEPVRKAVYLLALAALAVAGCHLDTLLSGGSGGGAPPRVATGALRAAAVTSGSNPPAGYTMTLDSSQPTSIGINDSVIATGIPAGSHRAALGSVPDNCNVSGDNPRTVKVPANDTGRTTFSVACTPPATQLAFTIQPPTTVTALSDTFQVEVTAEDSSGSLVPSFTGD